MTKKKPNFDDIESLWQLIGYLFRYRTKELLIAVIVALVGLYVLQLRSCKWDGLKPVVEKEPLQIKNPFKGTP